MSTGFIAEEEISNATFGIKASRISNLPQIHLKTCRLQQIILLHRTKNTI